jgi:hypothetical protein
MKINPYLLLILGFVFALPSMHAQDNLMAYGHNFDTKGYEGKIDTGATHMAPYEKKDLFLQFVTDFFEPPFIMPATSDWFKE